MHEPTPLTAAVRAFSAKPQNGNDPPRRGSRKTFKHPKWPEWNLVLDCETETNAQQRLLFGFYRFGRWADAMLFEVHEEGIFYADDLEERMPSGFNALRSYAAIHQAEEIGHPAPLRLRPRREFVNEVLWPAVTSTRALVVGFNLPFDLSRLAIDVSPGRGRYRNGFSFTLWDYWDEQIKEWRENPFRPRLRVKHRDSKGAFIDFATPAGLDLRHRIPPGQTKPAPGFVHRGYFLDLKTLGFALADRSLTLARTGELFGAAERKSDFDGHGEVGLEAIDYARQDVRATAALLVSMRQHFDRHPIDLLPSKAISPASISKAYLKAMGIRPPMEKFTNVSERVMGIAMSSYFGGRAEVRIRCSEMPIVYVDVLSMYPTVNALMGLWDFVVARAVRVVDATEDVRAFLDQVTLAGAFDPATWRQLGFFAEVDPDDDILPIRGHYDPERQTRNIALACVHGPGPRLWYAGPDLVASALLRGKPPRITRAIRIVPKGRQAGLHGTKLGGIVPIDPASDDFFRQVIEQRKGLKRLGVADADRRRLDRSLKTIANSGSYGVFAEFNRDETARALTEVRVCAPWGSQTERVEKPELPGAFCFPPLASLITSAARLMLALLERCVTDAGGSYVFCDTDSMAIVSTEEGALVQCLGGAHRMPDGSAAVLALTWEKVRAIVDLFSSLNPYRSPELQGRSIVKIEEEQNLADTKQRQIHCWAISAKRNALYERLPGGEIRFVKDPSEHGLGHLLPPNQDGREAWYQDFWRYLLALEKVAPPSTEPEGLDLPAVSRITISSPVIRKAFDKMNAGRSYGDQVKPANFVLAAHVAPNGFPVGVKPTQFHLVAPYSSIARQWLKADWRNLYDGAPYKATTRTPPQPGRVRLKTHADVLAEHRTHPEAKSSGPNGEPCERSTRGLLRRRSVRIASVELIGKESNRLEDVEEGNVHDLNDVQAAYESFDEKDWRMRIHPLLREIGATTLAAHTGLSREHLSRVLNGKRRISRSLRNKLAALVPRKPPALRPHALRAASSAS